MLCAATIGIVFLFKTSEHMEAAYGLAITVTMLMTTILLFEYLSLKKVNILLRLVFLFLFSAIESMF